MKNLIKSCTRVWTLFLGIALTVVIFLDAGTVTNMTTFITYSDLQEAINAASSGDKLQLDGIFPGNFVINQDKNLSLIGKKGAPTILDAGGVGRVLTIVPLPNDIQPEQRNAPLPNIYPNVNLERLTITGGNSLSTDGSGGVGGGLLNMNYNLSLIEVLIVNNRAEFGGGGFANIFGALSINHSVIRNNNADGGGAGMSLHSYLGVYHSEFRGNSAVIDHTGILGAGGGLFCADGTNTIEDCLFEGNSASNAAGGILNFNNYQTDLINSKLNKNSGGIAGGIYNIGVLKCLKVKIMHNKATSGQGGGIYNSLSSTLKLCSSKVEFNQASGLGGGIYNNSCQRILKNEETLVKNNDPDNIHNARDQNCLPIVPNEPPESFLGPIVNLILLVVSHIYG